MADHKIGIIISARNMVATGFKGVIDSAKNMSEKVSQSFRAAANGAKRIGLAVGALGAAFVLAMKKAEEFNQQLAQITTLSSYTVREAGKEVRKLSAEFGLAKEELTKGLYDALSAGVPKENAFTFLTTASKTAKAGAASVAESVDLLTTVMNAWGLSYEDTEKASDVLFTTVRLGKTTISELAESMSQAAPIASSLGVPLDQVAAALATMTKQGTPTAMAMTRIRAAIVGMSRTLGDGWSASMTLQQGFEAMAKKANGSENALKKMTGRIEGALGIMSMTGEKSKMAAADIAEFTKAGGAMADAFKKVENMNLLQRFFQSIHNLVLAAGDAALTGLAPVLDKAAKAAANFAEKIASWGEGESIKKIRDQIESLVDSLIGSAETRKEMISVLGDVVVSYFKVAADSAIELLKKGIPEIGRLFALSAKAALFGASFADKKEAEKQLLEEGKIQPKESNGPFNRVTAKEIEDRKKIIFARAEEISLAKKTASLDTENIKNLKGKTANQTQLNIALEKYNKLISEKKTQEPEVKMISATESIERSQREAAKRREDEKNLKAKKLAYATNAIEAELDAFIEAENKMNKEKAKLEKEQADLVKKLENEKAQARKDALQKQLDDAKKFAAMTVAEYIKSQQGQKDAAKNLADEDKKGKRLLEKEGRMGVGLGGNLSKKDQEWLNAWKNVRNEKALAAGAQKQLMDIGAKEQIGKLDEIKKLLAKNDANLIKLLQAG